MRSLLERPITFRLSDDARRRYAQAAADRGMTLSAYLRDRLEVDDQVAEHVSQLRLTLLDNAPSGQSDGSLLPILLELLLLTRRQSSPAELRAVHHELERQGVTPQTFK
ncbi:hypothetical protein DAI43_33715 [Achromobacter xylosoxidans]|uniref:hypothetical protein n=1 Tax=Achromobacter TaxID=222 RepID=UPI000D456A23|nr:MULTISPECIES: hypothetical protein [Achromobacter]MCP2516313.1 hypothetical protein [Achromobacter mucicolens]MDQ1758175.1 hypothetical protein [Achromobacter aegrifaciens]PTN43294.1 hypothetical protein DAI43_33715 [Achromobacter xylosoxidans]CAB3919651.1 hypothetical protein LMG26684_05604 [Achromobacter mucicolens]